MYLYLETNPCSMGSAMMIVIQSKLTSVIDETKIEFSRGYHSSSLSGPCPLFGLLLHTFVLTASTGGILGIEGQIPVIRVVDI